MRYFLIFIRCDRGGWVMRGEHPLLSLNALLHVAKWREAFVGCGLLLVNVLRDPDG